MSLNVAPALAAWREREAKVKAAVAALTDSCVDFYAHAKPDNLETSATCGDIRTVLAEIERLNGLVETLKKEAREAEREFQREARDIAAEATWRERQSQDGDYGSY